MMSSIVMKTQLKSLVSILVFSGVLASIAAAEHTATLYKRKDKKESSNNDTSKEQGSANDGLVRVRKDDNSGPAIDFGIAFGPRPALSLPQSEISRGKIVQLKEQQYVNEPCWEVVSGYAVARGWRPRIRGTTATAAAEGSTIIFQRTGNTERVFVPSGQPVTSVMVWLNNDVASSITLQVGQFVEVEVGRTDPLNQQRDVKVISEHEQLQNYVVSVLAQPVVLELPEMAPTPLRADHVHNYQ